LLPLSYVSPFSPALRALETHRKDVFFVLIGSFFRRTSQPCLPVPCLLRRSARGSFVLFEDNRLSFEVWRSSDFRVFWEHTRNQRSSVFFFLPTILWPFPPRGRLPPVFGRPGIVRAPSDFHIFSFSSSFFFSPPIFLSF